MISIVPTPCKPLLLAGGGPPLLVGQDPRPDPGAGPDQALDQAPPPPGHQGAGGQLSRGQQREDAGQQVVTRAGLQTLDQVQPHHHHHFTRQVFK